MSVDWSNHQLKDLCVNYKDDIVDGPFGANLKREHYKDEGKPVLKIQNIKPFSIILKKMDYVDEAKAEELKRHSYQTGDIIMTKLGLPLGISAIVSDIPDGVIVADLVRIRPDQNLINTKYLCYHLNSPTTSSFLNSQQKGATRPRVKISAVRELPINVPPLSIQEKIVEALDNVVNGINESINLTNEKLSKLSDLKRSMLEMGVTGKLKI